MMEKELLDVTKRSGIVFFGGILGASLNFIFTLIVTRYIGVLTYGRFIYIFTVISFFPLLCTLGLDKGLQFFVPKKTVNNETNDRNSLISFSFAVSFIVSIAVVVLIIVLSDYIASEILPRQKLGFVLRMLAPLIILLTFRQMADVIYRSVGNVATFVKNQSLITPVVQILAIIIFISLGYTIGGLIGAFYVGLFVSSIILLLDLKKLNLFTRFSFRAAGSYREIFAYSIPLLLSSLVTFFGSKADILFIGHTISSEKVAVYNVAFQIGIISNFALVAFNSIFASVITSLYYKAEYAKLAGIYKTITKWMVALNVICFSIILLFSEDILRIFGEAFVVGSKALILVSIGQLFNVGVGSAGLMITMTGRPQYSLYISLATAIVNIALNYVLIPIYGITGAGLASLVTVATANIARLIVVYRTFQIHPYDWSYLKIIIPALVSFVIVLTIKNLVTMQWLIELCVLSLVFLFIFGSVTILLGLSNDDKLILNKIVNKIKSTR
jgi:Membrane protein involved in the export of O-antigen and teichoic acid